MWVVLTVGGDVGGLVDMTDRVCCCACWWWWSIEDEEVDSIGSGAFKHDWIKFFPSGFVTRGWSLGVVNVYTRPVSDTTKSKTWVPVSVLNS